MENEILQTNQDFITTQLAKFNLADSQIQQWKGEFLDLQIAGVNDTEGYKVINRSRIFIKDRRVEITKEGKKLRQSAVDFQKAVIAEEKRLVDQLSEIEAVLEDKQKVVDAEKEKIKQAKEQKEQAKLQKRIADLTTMGMKFDGEAYVLNHLRFTALSIKLADDFTYNQFEVQVEAEWDKEQVRLVEEVRLKAEEEERFNKLREEQALELAKMAKEKAEIEAQLKKQKEEQAAILKAQQELGLQKELMVEAKINSKKSDLYSIGFTLKFGNFIFGEISVSELIVNLSDENWVEKLKALKSLVSTEKSKIEANKQLEIENQKKAAIEKALEEERVKVQQVALKKEVEEKAKQVAEEKLKEEKVLAEQMRPDTDKYLVFVEQLANMQLPEFSTEQYKNLGKNVNEHLLKFIDFLKKLK